MNLSNQKIVTDINHREKFQINDSEERERLLFLNLEFSRVVFLPSTRKDDNYCKTKFARNVKQQKNQYSKAQDEHHFQNPGFFPGAFL